MSVVGAVCTTQNIPIYDKNMPILDPKINPPPDILKNGMQSFPVSPKESQKLENHYP